MNEIVNKGWSKCHSLSSHFLLKDCFKRVRGKLVTTSFVEFVLKFNPMKP